MPPGLSNIVFERRYPALRRGELTLFSAEISRRIGGGRPFQTLIAGDTQLRSLNRRFRAKNRSTDVLSFPSTDPRVLGDIAISYDRAKEQARRFGHRTEVEVRILMLHGVLHLAGMDHETDGGRMARAEARWRKALDLPNGLIARTKS